MLFEEWEEKQFPLSAYARAVAERAWRAAQAGEQERHQELLDFAEMYVTFFERHCITNPVSVDRDFSGFLYETACNAIAKSRGK